MYTSFITDNKGNDLPLKNNLKKLQLDVTQYYSIELICFDVVFKII